MCYFCWEKSNAEDGKSGCSRKISPRFYYPLMKWRLAAAQVIWLIPLAKTNGIKYFSTNSLLSELIPAFYDKLFRFAEAINFIFYKTVSHIYDRTIEWNAEVNVYVRSRNECMWHSWRGFVSIKRIFALLSPSQTSSNEKIKFGICSNWNQFK